MTASFFMASRWYWRTSGASAQEGGVIKEVGLPVNLPEEWAQDPERRRAAGVPEEVDFATKPTLARGMVQRVLAAGARPAWVVADAVYGADYKLRSTLEEAEQPYVLAVTGQQCVWMGFGQRRVKAGKTQVPAHAWVELRMAAGTKGPRVFDWAALPINHPHGKEWQRFLLLWGAGVLIAHVLHWSNWRRHHQALAKFFHYKSRHALTHLQL